MKKEFTISELQNISLLTSVLRECSGVKPFALANRLNTCMKIANQTLKDAQDELNLINDRSKIAEDMTKDQITKVEAQKLSELEELMNKKFEVEMPEIKESEFENLEIDGEKTMPQLDQAGKQVGTYQISNRQAYFGLQGLLID